MHAEISETTVANVLRLFRQNRLTLGQIAHRLHVPFNAVSAITTGTFQKVAKRQPSPTFCPHCRQVVEPVYIDRVGWVPCLAAYLLEQRTRIFS